MNKININKIKLTPVKMGFNFCVFGEPEKEIVDWTKDWGFRLEKSGQFTNILVPLQFDISECFEKRKPFIYVDGFSPNLNKKLHIGHFSNLVIAKAFQKMNLGKEFISILGDTLSGDVSKNDAYNVFKRYCAQFDYQVDTILMASEESYTGNLLQDGTGKYEGTKIFDVGEDKVVGIKSDGSTSYFYQDVALATKLNAPTLYLTGSEQENHFKMLKELFPDIEHVGLGLVTVSGKKMASRHGNVIYISDVISYLMREFNDDIELCYNVFAGQILKSAPTVNKKINMDLISNHKTSPGLYLSYTMARMNSANVEAERIDKFNSNQLEFAYIKSRWNLMPNILFEALIEHCKNINRLYEKYTIKDNHENQVMFSNLYEDLILGARRLGFFIVKRV